MSVRYRIVHNVRINDTNIKYHVDILDDEYGGGVTEHIAGGNFFEWEYDKINERDPFSNPVQKSSFDVEFLVRSSTEETLLTDIIDADEDRFQIKFYIDDSLTWSGSVLNDLVEYPEAPYPFTAKIIAKDLSGLRGKDFTKFDAANRERLSVTIADILKDTGLTLPIRTFTNLTHNDVTQTDDFLFSLYHQKRIFQNRNKAMTKLEVLENICRAYNLILRQVGNRWIFEQIPAVARGDATQFDYDSDGLNPTSSTPSRTVTIDQSSNFILPTSNNKITGAIKAIESAYNHRTDIRNIFVKDELVVSSDTDKTLEFESTDVFRKHIKFDVTVNLTTGDPNGVSGDLIIKSKIERAGSGQDQAGTYFYDEDAGDYVLQNNSITIAVSGTGDTATGSIDLTSMGPIPADTFSATVEFTETASMVDSGGNDISAEITDATYTDINTFIYNEDSRDYSATVAHKLTRLGDYSFLESIPETVLGDGPEIESFGIPASGATSSDDLVEGRFKLRGIGEAVKLERLTLRERVHMRRNAMRNLQAALWMNYTPESLLSYDGETWFFLGGNFVANRSRWNAFILALDYTSEAGDVFERFVESGGAPSGTSTETVQTVGSGISLTDADARYLNEVSNLSDLDDIDTALGNLSLVTELKNLTSAEVSQIENINANTISNTQWFRLGNLDQGLSTTDLATFAGTNLTDALNFISTNRDIQSGGNNAIELDTSGNVTFPGNVTINGTTTSANTDNLDIDDPLIKLADGNTAGSVDIGFVGQRPGDNIAFIFDESMNYFTTVFTTDDATTAGAINITSFANLKVEDLIAVGDVTGANINATNWDTAYDRSITSLDWTRSSKELKITKQDTTTLTETISLVSSNITASAVGYAIPARTVGSAGDMSEINASNDNEVLRRSGTSLGFGKVANAMLENSTISTVSLGSNLASLSQGTGVATFSYNGSSVATVATVAASASVAGHVTTGTQTFAGAKTFDIGTGEFRIKDGSAMFVVDGSTGQIALGSEPIDDVGLLLDTPARAVTDNTDYDRLKVASSEQLTIAANTTSTIVATAQFNEPNINLAGSGGTLASVTNAATVYIEAAPTEGDSNWALYAPSGASLVESLDVNGSAFVDSSRNVTAGYIDVGVFTDATLPAHSAGRLFYNSDKEALSYYNEQSDIVLNIGQESMVRAKNIQGTTINDGDVVYISGASGDNPTAKLAKADAIATVTSTIGVVTQATIGNNAVGYVTTFGMVRGIDTSALTEGAEVFVSATTAGQLSETQPQYPNLSFRVGYVVRSHASEGILFIDVDREQDIYTQGSVLFADADGLPGQNNAKLNWDNTNFLLDIDGAATLSGVFTANGDITINETSTTVSSANFTSGFVGGSGTRLNKDSGNWKLELDDLILRGRLDVYELLINQLRATNGSVWVTATSEADSAQDVSSEEVWGTSDEVWGTSDEFFGDLVHQIFTPEDKFVTFAVDDLVRAQRFTGSGQYLVEGLVKNVENGSATVTDNTTPRWFVIELEAGSDTPAAGHDYVRYGNETDITRQGSVYITADDSDAPFIDVIDEVASPSDFGTSAKVKGRFGKLDGITHDGTALSGYGLFTQKGRFTEDIVVGDLSEAGNFAKFDGTTFTVDGVIKVQGSDAAIDSDFDTLYNNETRITLISSGKIATDLVVADSIAAGTITATEIATDTITSSELAADSVTATEINVSTLSAVNTNTGSLTVSDTLTMGASGEITNSASAYIIDDSGIRVQAVAGSADENSFRIVDGATNILRMNADTDTQIADINHLNNYSLRVGSPSHNIFFDDTTGNIQLSPDTGGVILGTGECYLGSEAGSEDRVRIDTTSTTGIVDFQGMTGDGVIRTTPAIPLRFQTNGSNTRMEITSSGSVSIFDDLSISGDITSSLTVANTVTASGDITTSSGDVIVSSGDVIVSSGIVNVQEGGTLSPTALRGNTLTGTGISIFDAGTDDGYMRIFVDGVEALNITNSQQVLIGTDNVGSGEVFRVNGTADLTGAVKAGGILTASSELKANGGISVNGNSGITTTRSWVDDNLDQHDVTIKSGIITAWTVT